MFDNGKNIIRRGGVTQFCYVAIGGGSDLMLRCITEEASYVLAYGSLCSHSELFQNRFGYPEYDCIIFLSKVDLISVEFCRQLCLC